VPLTGVNGNLARANVTISVEAPFVAASIGYGVVSQVQSLAFGPTLADLFTALPTPGSCRLRDISMLHVANAARRALAASDVSLREPNGISTLQFSLNPVIGGALLRTPDTFIDGDTLSRLFQLEATAPRDITFLYGLFDEATGRAFQSDPLLNLAGLGSADGDRPFRTFPMPITFEPRSNVRLEITELQTVPGELHVTLHGYKTSTATPPPPRRIRRSFRR